MPTSAPVNLPSVPPSTEFERQQLEFDRQVVAALAEALTR